MELLEGGRGVVARGMLVDLTAERFAAVLAELAAAGEGDVVVDLAAVPIVDSRGLLGFVHAAERLEPPAMLVVRRPSPAVARALEVLVQLYEPLATRIRVEHGDGA